MSILMEPCKIFVIIPAYNEESIIREVVADLLNANYKVVVVDDGSHTSLDETLKGLPVYLLRHSINLGQGAALQTGIEFALDRGADCIVTFDADGQHHTRDIEILVSALQKKNLDVVLGSRFMEGSAHNMAFGRKFLIQLARYVNLLFTGLLLSDAHNGIRAFTANAAGKIKITENRMAHATEILNLIEKHKLRYKEVPVQISYTSYSLKKGQTYGSGFRIFFDILLKKLFR